MRYLCCFKVIYSNHFATARQLLTCSGHEWDHHKETLFSTREPQFYFLCLCAPTLDELCLRSDPAKVIRSPSVFSFFLSHIFQARITFPWTVKPRKEKPEQSTWRRSLYTNPPHTYKEVPTKPWCFSGCCSSVIQSIPTWQDKALRFQIVRVFHPGG